ncbi:hypothetical protein DITRI_Ditri07aG0003000 [Diplodiscus trichospermus]
MVFSLSQPVLFLFQEPENVLIKAMAKHHPDLIMYRKQPVRPCTLVRVCDECNDGSFQGSCVICGGMGISDAYYCKECTQLEKDRQCCPKLFNLGTARTDLFYERKNMVSRKDECFHILSDNLLDLFFNMISQKFCFN